MGPAEHAVVRSRLMKIISPALLRKLKTMFEEKAEELVGPDHCRGLFRRREQISPNPTSSVFFRRPWGSSVNPETVLLFGNLNFNANGPLNDLYREAYKKVQPYLPGFEESFASAITWCQAA